MPFKKGIVTNPKGKKPGTKSKKTEEWEELRDFITAIGAKRYKDELMKLKGRDFLREYGMLLNYFKPRLTNIDANVKNEIELITPIQLVKASDYIDDHK